jgi:drug/metabolite transporter (DMT)-like permease
VLNSTVPLFGALVAVVWLRDRLSMLRVAGLLIGFAGVLILVWNRLVAGDSREWMAVLAGLVAAVLYGISANYTKQRLGRVDPIVTATGSLLAATAILLPVAILQWPVVAPTTVAWVSALLLGVVCTGVAFIYYYRLISHVGPAKTVTVTYLIPVFGVLWGRVFLHETITATMLTSCAVILVGTALATGAVSFPNRDTAASKTPQES